MTGHTVRIQHRTDGWGKRDWRVVCTCGRPTRWWWNQRTAEDWAERHAFATGATIELTPVQI